MNSALVYRISAVVVLAGFAVHHWAMTFKPFGVEEYHRRIRDAAKETPAFVGAWVGEDVPVPARSSSVLRPNVIISRRFANVETGISAGVLLVHCSDAHSMAGHFPLRCYPAEGWTVNSARPRDWWIGSLCLKGTEYTFSIEEPGRFHSIVVANSLLLPRGKILRDMDAMASAIVGAGGQAAGAGQIQVYFDASVPEAQRDAAIKILVSAYRPMIDAILDFQSPRGEAPVKAIVQAR